MQNTLRNAALRLAVLLAGQAFTTASLASAQVPVRARAKQTLTVDRLVFKDLLDIVAATRIGEAESRE